MTTTSTDRTGRIGDVAFKAPVAAASTGNLTLSGEQTIDGVVTNASRVLVKDQTTTLDNGIYVTDTGSWTRAKDFNGPYDAATGTMVAVTGGTANADSIWRVATAGGALTPSTDAITFEEALVSDASTVSFTAAGSNALASTVQRKLREVVSVFDFFNATLIADAIARTNNYETSALMQYAVDSFSGTTGGAVFMPEGNYRFSSQVLIDRDNIHIYGAGIEATQVLKITASMNVFSFGLNVTQREGCSIRDLSINVSGVTSSAGSGIRFRKTLNTIAERLRIVAQFIGITMFSANLAIAQDIYIVNTVASTGICVSVDGAGNDQFLNRVTCDAPAGSQPLAGFAVYRTDAMTIEDCVVVRSGIGITLRPAGTDTVDNLFFMNNSWDTCTNQGLSIEPAAGAFVRRLASTNDWFSSCDDSGVKLSSVGTIADIRFTSARFFNNNKHGFEAQGGTDFYLTCCSAAGNSRTVNNTYSGIFIAANIGGFQLTGNRCGAVASFGNFQKYGIEVSAGTSDNYLIFGNDCRTNATGGLIDGGSGTQKQVFGNFPFSATTDNFTIGNGSPMKRIMSATKSWDPPNVADGAMTSTTVTVTGALVGDVVQCGLSTLVVAGWVLSGYVSAADTVTVTLFNKTGGAVDLASGTLRATVTRF